MVREDLGLVMLFCQLSEVAVDVVGIAARGFELDGHVLDAELRSNAVLDKLKQLRHRVMLFDHDVAGEHDQPRLNRPDVQVMHVLDAGDRLYGCGHMRCADAWWG